MIDRIKAEGLSFFLVDCRRTESTPVSDIHNQEIAILATHEPTIQEAERFLEVDIRPNRNHVISVSALDADEALEWYTFPDSVPVLGRNQCFVFCCV